MKKNFIYLVVLCITLAIVNIMNLPNIEFNKIEYVSYSNFSSNINTAENSNDTLANCVIVQLQLNYYATIDSKESRHLFSDESFTATELKAQKKEYRQRAKALHKRKNSEIINTLFLGNYQSIYKSNYSPFVDITYDYEYYMKHKTYILENITKSSIVKTVSIMESYIDYEGQIEINACRANAQEVYQQRTRTGDGISIGILEPSLVNPLNSGLQDSVITLRPYGTNALAPVSHATMMALIICGEDGIAPDSIVYSAFLDGTMTEEVEWMLDNDVDIINMSFGEDLNQANYSSVSAYVDYITSNYYVTVVAAAGNAGEGSGKICNPGLGYNVITVGNVHNTGERVESSSYLVNSGPIKPTIGMYADNVYIGNDEYLGCSGTSAGTALTTGLIALLFEGHSTLTVNRERLLALIAANAKNTEYQSFTERNGFDYYLGAGAFDYGNIEDNYSKSGMVAASGEESSVAYTKTIYVQAGKTLRASIATIADSDGTVNGISFTDYDLFIKNSSGSYLAFAESSNSTIEVVTYTVPTSGYYTIEVLQQSERTNTRDYIGYAYRIY